MSDVRPSADWTCDQILDGQLQVWQSRRGYRFSIDALLLAFHAAVSRPSERILDLGTGCGIIPLVTAWRFPTVSIIGVEIQPELAALARFNAGQNSFSGRITIIEDDYTRLPAKAVGPPVDMVVANPPYRRPSSGRINPKRQRALARHEIAVTLQSLIQAMRRFLKTGGRGWMIYTVERMAELLADLRSHHLEPKYLRLIHSHRNVPAKHCLIKVVKGARPGLQADAPLIIYKDEDIYTAEVTAMLRP